MIQPEPVVEPPTEKVTFIRKYRNSDAWLCTEVAAVVKCKLRARNPSGAYFVGAQLLNANFNGAGLVLTEFQKSGLHGTNFSGASLISANLEGAELDRAIFKRAYLGAAYNITGAPQGANLKQARLNGAIFDGADLEGTYLEGADLSGANFFRCTELGPPDLKAAL